MGLPDILATSDPREFRSQQARIRKERGTYHISIVGPEMGFPEMMDLRNQGSDPAKVQEALEGKGYLFANLGISASLSTTIDGEPFAVGVLQERRDDLGDTVVKLVSGYIDKPHLRHPRRALRQELAEEILPTADGKILRGFEQGSPLPQPFKETAPYETKIGYQAFPNTFFTMPDLVGDDIFIGHTKVEGMPGLYFQIPTNSAQLVFPYHIDIPRLPQKDISLAHAERSYITAAEASMNHAEDVFNPKKGVLETRRHDNGLLLMELCRAPHGVLPTGNVFTFEKGSLKPYDTGGLLLSEAFAPKVDGLVAPKNIPFERYVTNAQQGATLMKRA